MTWKGKLALLALSAFSFVSLLEAASLTGSVKSPDGAPFSGAFVQAQNTRSKITYMGLSDAQGRYRVEKLPAGEYRVTIRAVGYRAEPRTGLSLSEAQQASADFTLQKGTVHWNDLSIYQASKLWPASPAKDKIFSTCFTCHGFQTRMASVTRDVEGWRDRVEFMRTAMHFGLEGRVSDQQADMIAEYLAKLYGPDSTLPKSPADMPEYKETVRPFSNDAMKIAYVEYEMPGPSRMPFSAAPGKSGYVWIPNFGIANKITRLDPKTGEMTDYPVPNIGTAAVHSAVEAPDGSVWLTEQGSNKLGRWDPKTQKVTEWQDARIPGGKAYDAGSKHTVRFDGDGNPWYTGEPFGKFDLKTHEFVGSKEVTHSYDVKEDQDGNMWFTKTGSPNGFGMVNSKTMKFSIWYPPTKDSFPRRIEVDHNGIVWSGEYRAGNLLRFDPKTQQMKEYKLPGPQPTPYGLGVDAKGRVWYSSYNMDVIGCFDPKTEKVVEFPFPHSENTIRELIPDSQGRMWYGSPSNNRVGYFYLLDDSR